MQLLMKTESDHIIGLLQKGDASVYNKRVPVAV